MQGRVEMTAPPGASAAAGEQGVVGIVLRYRHFWARRLVVGMNYQRQLLGLPLLHQNDIPARCAFQFHNRSEQIHLVMSTSHIRFSKVNSKFVLHCVG